MPHKRKTKRRRGVTGRSQENTIYKKLSEKYPFVFRFNENRFKPTPADIIVCTSKYTVLIEVKAGSKQVRKHSVRPNQQEALKTFQTHSKAVSMVALYFRWPKPSYHILTIEEFNKLPSIIKPEHVQKYKISQWGRLNSIIKKARN